MWKCKECGKEVTVLAVTPVLYEVFLDKNKKIFDYEDYRKIDLKNAKIKEILCEHCGNEGNLEDIAEWEEDK
ncbi:hypothetical protein I6E17_02125 [Fusobacterium perfoetens]|uniref:hypothetical protein n=1 Tax=Fusobacterium perfoetens TaxID=852 RepID=UPI001F44B9A8|nr:hypothetical protein [Fusobacterium perfoetens]MCF2624973.1 hypothetical protein [Fusobacterium perfoetens]